ncbi:MAG: hypothetical protein AAGA56_05840, partial [Myxococcota bacterium]
AVHNPEQLTVDDRTDADGDGIGDACDAIHAPFDPTVYKRANRNREYEESAFLREHESQFGASRKPTFHPNHGFVIKRSVYASEAQMEAARELLRTTIVPDEGDPVPVAYGKLGMSKWPMMDLPDDAGECEPLNAEIVGCGWTFHNRIELQGSGPPAVTGAADDDATAGLRFCDCEQTGFTKAQRDVCEILDGCRRDHTEYENTNSNWKRIETYTVDPNSAIPGDPVNPGVGLTYKVDVDNNGWTDTPLYWDFRSLTNAVQQFGPAHYGVKGVLWTSLRGTDTNFSSLFSRTRLRETAHTYGPGNGFLKWTRGRKRDRRWDPLMLIPCSWCDLLVTALVIDEWVNPADRIQLGVNGPLTNHALPELGPGLLGLFEDERDGRVKLVQDGNWLGRADRGIARTAGLVLDSSNGQPVGALFANPDDPEAVPALDHWSGLAAPPVVAPGSSFAFSDARQALYLIGGRVDGHAHPTAYSFELETETWSSTNLTGHDAVETTLAATYSEVDGAVWFLSHAGEDVYLGRWRVGTPGPAGAAVEVLARFPSSWQPADGTYALTSGYGGELVASLTTPGSAARVAVFRINGQTGGILIRGEAVLDGDVSGGPVATPAGLVFTQYILDGEETGLTINAIRWDDVVVDPESGLVAL